nr:hypothetical protein [Prevotella sp.]
MKTIQFFRCCAVMVVTTAFTACAEFVSDNNNTGETIGLPGNVNVMNENLANAKSRTGSDLVAPAIHTSMVSGSDKPIYFRYTTTPGIQPRQVSGVKTRGTLVTTDNFYDSYCLYSYLYLNTDKWTTSSSTTSPSYSDEEVFKGRNWSTAEFWPGAGVRCAFFAYAPYHAAGLSAFTTAGWPTFHYTVPANATAQNDLLVTRNDPSAGLGDYGNIDVPGNFNAKDYITFDHACTAIRFAIGKQMAPGTIKKIEIQNVYGEADYQYQTENWTNHSTLSTFSLTKDIPVKATDSNVVLNNDDDVFLMIPQKVPFGAAIAVTINDGEEHVLKARIDNDDWLKGYTVTYYLSTAEVNTNYVLSISPASTSIPSSGGTDVLTINSYKQTYYGSQVAVPWTATYTYDENGDAGTTVYNSTNAAVTGFTANSNGSIVGEKVNFSVVSASSSTTTPAYRSTIENSTHTKTLREATDGSCDLANGKQTANCYVIHAPGHYSFPLVYGNALNADKTYNTNSYGTPTFVDHQGKQIDNPYIYETNGGANVPYDACIVWQDAPHLITPSSLKLSSDNHSIEFDVERDNICQGNSLVAVRDKNGNIMWSWHIWVTDYALNKTYEVHNNPDNGGTVTSNFMEVPLGWCDAEVRVGDEFRNFHITVKQTASKGETSKFNIIQYSGQYVYGGNAPFYEWGRKDPFLPSDGVGNSDKPYYDNQYTIFSRLYGAVATDVAISHPYIYYYLIAASWSSTNSFEFWNRGNTVATLNNNIVNKTIYSPSPSGYVEPRAASFTGYTYSNTTGSYDKGWTFYSNPNRTGATHKMPSIGFRDVENGRVNTVNGGYVNFYGDYSGYWTAGPSASGYSFSIFTGYNILDSSHASGGSAFGFFVLPVSE